jgi:Ni,Fe-hydrogenase III small subunit
MGQWVLSGLRTGIKSTRYPRRPETAPGVSPGLPTVGVTSAEEAAALASRCPTGALTPQGQHLHVDPRRCVHCFRCARDGAPTIGWQDGYEWGALVRSAVPLGPAFRRSVHIRVVDAGDCGACLHEVRQLNNPYYNMHRLGLFITPTPRQADLLLVVGPVTDPMREPLLRTYEAMPEPKRVVAVGACALSGGVFGASFACAGGVAEALPVDVEVPGNPPPPLAILHGLLVAVGRKPSAPWPALAGDGRGEGRAP